MLRDGKAVLPGARPVPIGRERFPSPALARGLPTSTCRVLGLVVLVACAVQAALGLLHEAAVARH